MSLESANKFWKQVQADHQFRDRLKAATNEQELSSVIVGAGFQVTGEELETSLAEWQVQDHNARELSDSELESVAGGSLNFAASQPQFANINNGIQIVGRGGKG